MKNCAEKSSFGPGQVGHQQPQIQMKSQRVPLEEQRLGGKGVLRRRRRRRKRTGRRGIYGPQAQKDVPAGRMVRGHRQQTTFVKSSGAQPSLGVWRAVEGLHSSN
ncbi:unnamed protein product [Nesidiocoris tenuis]|uniref:Uncharacterized protein n=1 Tax=Nesidiocoris tenuis TaxID=355587 RepID=A0A6H5GUF5_9HEMI|nr:unnamed protein product [Nesidiocoris tenuis]